MSAWRGFVSTIAWSLDLCDTKESPSLSKGLAAAVGIVALRDAWLRGFSVLNVSAMALAVAAAFGRSVFMNWLSRNQWSATHSITTNTNLTGDLAAIAAVVTKNRDHEKGVDPA